MSLFRSAQLPRLASSLRGAAAPSARSLSSSTRVAMPSKALTPAAAVPATSALASSSKLSLPSAQRFASTDAQQTEMTVRDALNSAMEEEMLRDDSVFIMGEEVARCECNSSGAGHICCGAG